MTIDSSRLFKRKYIIVFYESDDDTFKYMFDNIREVCSFMGKKPTKQNLMRITADIVRSEKRWNHRTNLFRGQSLRVYLVDMINDNEIKEDN